MIPDQIAGHFLVLPVSVQRHTCKVIAVCFLSLPASRVNGKASSKHVAALPNSVHCVYVKPSSLYSRPTIDRAHNT